MQARFTRKKGEQMQQVIYLGNMAMDHVWDVNYVAKTIAVIWNKFQRAEHANVDIVLAVWASGLRIYAKEQPVIEYNSQRIYYCIADKNKLFVWLYRHESKQEQSELRCHAVLCKTIEEAKALAHQLHQKLICHLTDFMKSKHNGSATEQSQMNPTSQRKQTQSVGKAEGKFITK